jgi:hypothetical protein
VGEKGNSTFDCLVPPPWPWWARRLVALAALLAVVLTGAVWGSGLVVPRLESTGAAGGEWQEGELRGGSVTGLRVAVVVEVENRGRFPATITGWIPPDTTGIEWDGGVEPAPVELAPGEKVELRIQATVDDCREARAEESHTIRLRTRGPLPGTWRGDVQMPAAHHPPPGQSSDPGGFVPPPTDWAPSWVYSVLHWPCDREVNQHVFDGTADE